MNNRFIIAMILILLLALVIAVCRDASEVPGITPTLSISATPSDTPGNVMSVVIISPPLP